MVHASEIFSVHTPYGRIDINVKVSGEVEDLNLGLSWHVETVVVLRDKRVDGQVDVDLDLEKITNS